MTLLIVCNGFSSLIVDGKNEFYFFACCLVKFFSESFFSYSLLETLENLDECRNLTFSFSCLLASALKLVTAFPDNNKQKEVSLAFFFVFFLWQKERTRYQHFLYVFNISCFASQLDVAEISPSEFLSYPNFFFISNLSRLEFSFDKLFQSSAQFFSFHRDFHRQRRREPKKKI